MVVLGGLEIAAVGYLLNEFNKDKIEQRERRKNSSHRPENGHHDRPHDDRPHSRPHSNSRPPPPQPYYPQSSSANLLAPPSAPMRPLSAPPQDPRPEWQRPQGYGVQQMGPQFANQQSMSIPPNGPQQRPPQGPPGNEYPFQSELWHKQQAQQAQQQRPPQPPTYGPGPNHLWQPGSQTGPQGLGQFMNGPPPGPGQLQRPQTFQQGQQNPPNQPYLQSSSTFPRPPQQFQQGPPQPFLQHQNTFPNPNQNLGPPPHQQPPPPSYGQMVPAPINQQPSTGPLVYINTKTGKVSHNLYPVDHPMHRSAPGDNPNGSNSNLALARSGTDLNDPDSFPRELWGDEKYMRTMAGDVHTGLIWSEKDEDDLAYGKDYSFERERRKQERARQRGRSDTLGREVSYERVRTDRDR